jgi:dimethylaniline monooxygenase (N-oxide forming)
VINTSKEMSAFSDFPPPASAPPFMHNVQMRKYFESYAKQFGVVDHIRYNHLVVSVDRHADYDENGTWTVKYQDNNGHLHEELFDYVLLCCGHHAHPNWPKPWPGQEHFKGRIIHSHSYKNHSGFEDQVTVGVGIGNSGADVVCELSRVASQVSPRVALFLQSS